MDLSHIKTKRGAVVSIHFGKITTTNLWSDFGWYEITDGPTLDDLRQVKMCEINEEFAKQKEIIDRLLTKDPDSIGHPYRRTSVRPSMEGAPRPSTSSEEVKEEIIDKNFKEKVCDRLIKFFKDFTFIPAIRFVNTLANQANVNAAQNYISCYMNLCDHPDKNEINDKIKSDEFKYILMDLLKCKTDKKVNNRLEIYYGPAGTGKTTAAINKYPDAAVTVCSEMMDSTDLMKVFSFNDENGNPVFKPSTLQLDMIEGRPHILDEINLLPMSTLRYLQGILDGKKEIEFEGKKIEIKDGFKIIGTMNLIVNGQVFSLPEPIVDRAAELNCSEINNKNLANYAL